MQTTSARGFASGRRTGAVLGGNAASTPRGSTARSRRFRDLSRAKPFSFDSGFDGTGAYTISRSRTTRAITVGKRRRRPDDNGAIRTGQISLGDVDVWTFTANAGDRIRIARRRNDRRQRFPSVARLGAERGDPRDTAGVSAAVINGAVARSRGPTSFWLRADSAFDGTGTLPALVGADTRTDQHVRR